MVNGVSRVDKIAGIRIWRMLKDAACGTMNEMYVFRIYYYKYFSFILSYHNCVLQYLADIEDHLNITIPQVGEDMKVPVNEFDGKVFFE